MISTPFFQSCCYALRWQSYELCLVSLLEIIRKMESIFNLTIIPHKPIFQMHSTKSNIIPPPFNVISIHNTSAKSRSATTKAQHYAITSVVQTPSCHYHNLYGKEKIMGKGTKWRGSARMNGPRVMKCDSPNDVWHIRDPSMWRHKGGKMGKLSERNIVVFMLFVGVGCLYLKSYSNHACLISIIEKVTLLPSRLSYV